MDMPKREAGPLLQKSFAFAVRMMKFYRHLQTNEREFIISKQLVRSATSIGANAEEATGAISTADFTSKISIAYKEARETSYWLRLLQAAGYSFYLFTTIVSNFVVFSTPFCGQAAAHKHS
ncbi:MAG: four helix bundle protein [Hymenobacter sp.]|nr:four helix bundle protein [Hymenobacter sp.]